MGLCERCGKAQATFHLTNIEHGEKSERHLCDRCATEEGLLSPQVGLADAGFLESFLTSATKAAAPSVVCEHCGISYVEFRNQGLLGCPHDYDAFKEPLEKLLRRAQDGSTHHVGKNPQAGTTRRGSEQEVRRLRKLLAEAVQGEDYERAADLRDQIADLESR
jgi:protein arginine kinase activator